MVVDDRVVVAVLRLRRLVSTAARAHDLERHPVVVDGLRALDELDLALRASVYGAASPDLPQRPEAGWMGTQAVAERLGITPRAVRFRIGTGALRAARDRRGYWRIDPASITDERTSK